MCVDAWIAHISMFPSFTYKKLGIHLSALWSDIKQGYSKRYCYDKNIYTINKYEYALSEYSSPIGKTAHFVSKNCRKILDS